jgi:hypothetical protein
MKANAPSTSCIAGYHSNTHQTTRYTSQFFLSLTECTDCSSPANHVHRGNLPETAAGAASCAVHLEAHCEPACLSQGIDPTRSCNNFTISGIDARILDPKVSTPAPNVNE